MNRETFARRFWQAVDLLKMLPCEERHELWADTAARALGMMTEPNAPLVVGLVRAASGATDGDLEAQRGWREYRARLPWLRRQFV